MIFSSAVWPLIAAAVAVVWGGFKFSVAVHDNIVRTRSDVHISYVDSVALLPPGPNCLPEDPEVRITLLLSNEGGRPGYVTGGRLQLGMLPVVQPSKVQIEDRRSDATAGPHSGAILANDAPTIALGVVEVDGRSPDEGSSIGIEGDHDSERGGLPLRDRKDRLLRVNGQASELVTFAGCLPAGLGRSAGIGNLMDLDTRDRTISMLLALAERRQVRSSEILERTLEALGSPSRSKEDKELRERLMNRAESNSDEAKRALEWALELETLSASAELDGMVELIRALDANRRPDVLAVPVRLRSIIEVDSRDQSLGTRTWTHEFDLPDRYSLE